MFIKLTSYSDDVPLYINLNYVALIRPDYKVNSVTVVVMNNDVRHPVKETPEYILQHFARGGVSE